MILGDPCYFCRGGVIEATEFGGTRLAKCKCEKDCGERFCKGKVIGEESK